MSSAYLDLLPRRASVLGSTRGKEFLSAGHQVENRLVAHQFRHVDLGFEDGRVNAGGHVLPRVDILRPYSRTTLRPS